ncbi:DEAD/DEAH box helicase [Candidatus Poriferisocius sp.]|uniref:DEAD/DEAH box helicase n=1 Tax=Candidatus Poriferisocius sp. TaxID=3101276 RepID=UPI003B02C666
MQLKRYQERTLEQLAKWFECLDACGGYPGAAWERAGFDRHVSRKDSSGKPIPHICLKVPTGGGKTFLAAQAVLKSKRRTGLLLWVVPNKAIFAQTKKALWNREHPYRTILNLASGGRVKVMEKDDNLSRQDVENYLCVMLLSVQAANRTNNREFLKMFQESGRYSSFFPDVDDTQMAEQLLNEHPGLYTSEEGRVLSTLANVFKVSRPVIVLDEAHKSYGRNFDHAWFNQFDPSLIIELSATPDQSRSNILVDIGGQELKDEEMIKLPIQVTGYEDTSWKDILREAGEQLKGLSSQAEQLLENNGTYIRPMIVVRVERTGQNQRGEGRLHAEDVREFLVSTMGINADEVKVQSSDLKELESEDLLSEQSKVRWIITKDALKEGWDCSFAYILVLLDNTRAKITVTQMMGRVLRQPYGRLTGIDELDRCYVHCQNASVDLAVSAVKRQLQNEGFGDLEMYVRGGTEEAKPIRTERRSPITPEMTRLPRVLHKDKREIDYDMHILAGINWAEISPPENWEMLEIRNRLSTAAVDIGEDGFGTSKQHYHVDSTDNQDFDLAWHARQLGDAIPNPWQAARVVTEAVESLLKNGHDHSWIGERRPAFLRAIERHALDQIDEQAERLFKNKLDQGEITFDLDLPFEYCDWYELEVPRYDPGAAFQRTLFSPAYNHNMNNLEKKYAIFLDGNPAIQWWHKIAARKPGEYRLQGWRKDYVYPDFVALQMQDTIIVHEVKGEHLRHNDDTQYKQRLLNCLESQFNSNATVTIHGGTVTADFKLIFEKDIP